ncbi:n-acyl-d-glucosamine 2-epimerase [Sinomicrobium soli]|uniref:AGE family epimerase/isomerase n=1 Tax=Sinomicrobium sp. N-1-3-6 TaxID=2219864 RepID=UPI00397B256D
MSYKNIYQDNLLKQTVPFWENYSLDKEYGGYFTCLTANGNVYDTDKFIWLQCRQVWTFSKLYGNFGADKNWLEIATHGADFLENYGRGKDGSWYFALDRKGHPLVQPYNIFSDCFAAMAFGQLSKITGESRYTEIAKTTFQNILERQENPKGKYNKAYPNTRELQNLGLPMILSNLVLELDHILHGEVIEQQLNSVKDKIVNQFYKPEYGIILENVGLNGEISDSFQGRHINPGHGLETLWFLMDIAERQGDSELILKGVDIVISTLEYGWDGKYGGLYYFMDLKGSPPEQLEWSQKLWWPHIEAMIACLKGFYLTRDMRCWEWFVKLHDYTWEHFVDEKYGEWFGYLTREGKVNLELKGGKWKGCFHVPRGLMILSLLMKNLEEYAGNMECKA